MSATTQAISHEEPRIGEGASTAVLLYLLLLSVTGSMAAADFAENLGLLSFAAIGGVTLGIFLAKIRRLPGWIAHWLMLLLSVPVIATLAATTLPNVLLFNERLIVLEERVQVWVRQVMSGNSAGDNLVFVIQLCLLIWIIAYLAAWSIYRHHWCWGAIIPAGIVILVNLFYTQPQSGLYFGLYILSALLILVRLNLQTMERQWRGAAIGYPPDINVDFLWYGAVFAIALMFLVWLLPDSAPGPSWLSALEPLQTPWQSVEDQFNRMFNSLRAVGRPASSVFLGTTLTMGGPVNLGQRPVMDIRTNAGRYWRAAVYDKYTGLGWLNTHLDSLNLGVGDPRLNDARTFSRVEITQTITLYLNDQNTLYAHSQPVRFDVPTEVRYGKPAPDLLDVALIRSRRPLREGSTYVAVSAISVADEDALRNDSLRYSDWITSTYLQLPEALPARVRNLAKEITGKSTNPYDQAAAIEKYVRDKIKYNDLVSAPPTGRDGVDYTLFDRPEGYCNYYASVMAVLARAVGIPARVVSGYTLGDYQDGVYHIVEANAHAWVEVYFPSYGWIEFEPTANKPEIDRPKKVESGPNNPDLDAAANEARRRQLRDRTLEDAAGGPAPGGISFDLSFWSNSRNLAIVGGIILGLLALAGLYIAWMRNAQRDTRLAPAARIYERMLQRARWLGIREEKSATPLERARAISQQLSGAQPPTERIAASYTRERFGARALDVSERSALARDWDAWRSEWWRAFAALTRDRLARPFRALAENVRGMRRRIEHWGVGRE